MGRANQRNGLITIILVTVVLLLSPSPLFDFGDSIISGEQVLSIFDRGEGDSDAQRVSGRELLYDWTNSPQESVNSIAISADGQYIAMGTAGPQDSVFLFEQKSGIPLWEYGASGMIGAIAISASGQYIVAGSTDAEIYLFGKDSSTPIWNYTTAEPVRVIDISSDGQSIAAGTDSAVYYAHRDQSTGDMDVWTHNLTNNDAIESLALSGDGYHLIAGTSAGDAHFFNASQKIPLWTFSPGADIVVAISNDGGYVVVGCSNVHTNLYVLDSSTPSQPLGDYATQSPVQDVGISDYGLVASISTNGRVLTFTLGLGNPIMDYWPFSGDSGHSIAVSLSGADVIAGFSDGSKYFQNGELLETFSYIGEGSYVDISDDGDHFVVGGSVIGKKSLYKFSTINMDDDADGVINSLDQCPETLVVSPSIPPREVDENGCWWGQFDTDGDSIQNSEDICPLSIVSPCDSPNNWILGSTIRPNDADDILEVLFSSEGDYLYTSSHNTHQFSRWALSPNEGRDSLGVNNYDPRVTVHEYPLVYFDSPINSDELVITCRYQSYNCPLSLHESNGDFIQNIAVGNMSEVQFSNDGRLLLAAEYQPNPMIRAYDTTTWEEIYHINSPLEDKSIMDIEFSPDDTIVAIAGGLSNVRLFNTTSWDLIGEFPIQNWQGFSFSPDGNYFSYVKKETHPRELIIRDMNDGSEIIKTLNGTSDRIEISFSPDSTQIAILRDNSGNTIYCSDCTPPAGHDFGGLQVYRLDTWQLVLEFDCPSREGAGGYACIEGGVFFSPVGDVLAVPTHHAGVSETGIMLFGADRDNDLIADFIDLCSSTQLNAAIDSNGCSPSQVDSDADGVYDNWDQCAGTVDGATVDGIGCAMTQIDSDADGISDAADQCPNTPNGDSVGLTGCSGTQIDLDNDGIFDSEDDCPNSPSGSTVDVAGCAPDDVIDLDSDGDGVRDSVDECSNSEQGIITNENGCEVIFGAGTESVDDSKVEGIWIFISVIALLLAFVKYSEDNEEWWGLLIIIALIIMIFLPGVPIESNVESIPGHGWIMQQSCDEASSDCWKNDGINDNTQYRQGLVMCFFFGAFGIIVGAFLVTFVGTPGMIIGGLFIFVGITGGTFMWLWGTFVLGLFEIFAGNPYWIINLSFLIISSVAFFGASPTVGVAATFAPASVPASVASSPSAVNHSRGKIDHEQIKRLVRQYSDDDDVFWHYTQFWSSSVKESSLKNAIKHRRGEYKKEMGGKSASNQPLIPKRIPAPKQKKSSKQSKPTLASQASSKPMARESASVKQNRNSSSDAAKDKKRKGAGIKGKGKKSEMIVPSSSQPMDLNTDVLANNSYSESQKKQSKITTDSSGITTIETGFSIVTLNKLTDEVTKVPISTEQHEMFYQEIKNMEYLDEKGFDVGLKDIDKGPNPIITMSYFGPDRLTEHYDTLNQRGKFNLFTEVINEVRQMHKIGMVHRDLKPDNILVDARPRDGNHQFDAIIDFGIAMKINRKQSEIYNTAGTKFFGHSSQKDVNYNASTGQDWFSLARIFALILRGTSIDSLNAEILMSQTGLDMRNEIQALGFNDKVVDSMTELIIQSTKSSCEQHETVGVLARIGKQLGKDL